MPGSSAVVDSLFTTFLLFCPAMTAGADRSRKLGNPSAA